jgi:glutamine amidotransferase
MKLVVVDYGMGNLGSVRTAVQVLGHDASIISSPKDLILADKIILPGVGNFNDAVSSLRSNNWFDPLKENVVNLQKPILGICLGMQLLASYGQEGGNTEGLDLISGEVKHLSKLGIKRPVPHVGWNDTHAKNNSVLFSSIGSGHDFFYVHSYYFSPTNTENISSVVHYEKEVVASVEKSNIFGTQFHPEKSSKVGLKLLKNFLEI